MPGAGVSALCRSGVSVQCRAVVSTQLSQEFLAILETRNEF